MAKTKYLRTSHYLDNVRLGLSFPSVTVAFFRGGKVAGYQKLQWKFLESLSHLSTDEVLTLLSESSKKKELILPKKLQIFEKSVVDINVALLYYLVRAYKPKIAVETGVWSGKTSWSILKAMEDNDEGKLFSIDLGVKQWGSSILPTKEIGGFVPESLHSRWQLILGDSREKLPPILDKLNIIDLFYHDSDSSNRELVNLEFNTAIRHLKKGGVFCSDDVYDENNTFNEISTHLRDSAIIGNKVGYAFKPE